MTAPSPSTEPHLAAPDTNPSFTKGVFLGEIREDLVFPFPALSPEERESLSMILDSFRAFAAERVDSAKFDHDGKFPDGVRQGMHELGRDGARAFPRSTAASARRPRSTIASSARSARPTRRSRVYFGAHQSIGCKGIVLFGTRGAEAEVSARDAPVGRARSPRSASPSRARAPTRRR